MDMDFAKEMFRRGRYRRDATHGWTRAVTLIIAGAAISLAFCTSASAVNFQATYCNGQVYFPLRGTYRLECGQAIMHQASEMQMAIPGHARHFHLVLVTGPVLAVDGQPVIWDCDDIRKTYVQAQVQFRRRELGADSLLGALLRIKNDSHCVF